MTTHEPTKTIGVTRARAALVITVTLLAVLDLGLKAWAGTALADGRTVDLGPVQLRLGFNSGVAFSLGADLPAGVVLGVTGLIIVALAIFAWRATRTATLPARLALAAVLAGAVANLLDRAGDGMVTDYLHTGWFPTFNLADVFITTGAVALVLISLRGRTADLLTFHTPAGEPVALASLTVTALVDRVPGVEMFQLVHTAPARLEVRLQPSAGTDPERIWQTVHTEIRRLLVDHGLGHVTVARGKGPPQPTPGGKFRPVIPLR